MSAAPTLVPGDKAWCLFALASGEAEPLPSEVRFLKWSRDREGGLLAAVLVPVGANIQAKEFGVKLEDGTRGKAKLAWVNGAALGPHRLRPATALRFKNEPDTKNTILTLLSELQDPTEVYETASEEEKSSGEIAFAERLVKVESGGRALHEEVKQQGKNLTKLMQLLESNLGKQPSPERGQSRSARMAGSQDPLLQGLAQHGSLFSGDIESEEEEDEPEHQQEHRRARKSAVVPEIVQNNAAANPLHEDPGLLELEMLKSLERPSKRGANHSDSDEGSGLGSGVRTARVS